MIARVQRGLARGGGMIGAVGVDDVQRGGGFPIARGELPGLDLIGVGIRIEHDVDLQGILGRVVAHAAGPARNLLHRVGVGACLGEAELAVRNNCISHRFRLKQERNILQALRSDDLGLAGVIIGGHGVLCIITLRLDGHFKGLLEVPADIALHRLGDGGSVLAVMIDIVEVKRGGVGGGSFGDGQLALSLGDVVVVSLELIGRSILDGVGDLALADIGDRTGGPDVGDLALNEAVAANGDLRLGQGRAIVNLAGGFGGQGDAALVDGQRAVFVTDVIVAGNIVALCVNNFGIARDKQSLVLASIGLRTADGNGGGMTVNKTTHRNAVAIFTVRLAVVFAGNILGGDRDQTVLDGQLAVRFDHEGDIEVGVDVLEVFGR